MNTAVNTNPTGQSSMRRTLLTLLGAIAAFGVLTASYATAELPEAAAAATIDGASSPR
ncbi:hypothetical protein [Mangrovicella endophytica]|uniref:hypothetical protein n=1 Tax=Mangrovicella endophytica TaxID=2066697 RepID=UPI0012FFF546|nr:hypothetical protein [Mangrovicella endophytica]